MEPARLDVRLHAARRVRLRRHLVRGCANAEGWALAVAKIGSIAGPVIGGVLLRMHLPGYQLFYVAAIPLLFSAAFACGLGRVARGWRHSGAAAAEQAR